MSIASRERHKSKIEYFEYLKETAMVVDPYVKSFFEARFSTANKLKNILMNKYRFGKPQLRPAQVRMAYEIIGGDKRGKILPACASVEIKDTGYYCYDDVMDLKKNIKGTLVGGMLISLSYVVAQNLLENFDDKKVQQVFDALVELDKDNLDGAFIDLELKNGPDKEKYMEKAKRYNFWGNALKIGAILGGGSDDEIMKLQLIGQNIGTAYIISNDTRDFGKKLEDFRAGKYTLPIIYFLENTTDADRKKLMNLFGKENLNNIEIEYIKKLAVKSGTIQYGKYIAKNLCDKGIKFLNEFPDTYAKKQLQFSTTMTQRNRYFDELKKYKN